MNDLRKAAIDMLDHYISLAESGQIHWRNRQEKEAIALLKALMDQPCKTGSQCIGGKCLECEREWVGLTDDEAWKCWNWEDFNETWKKMEAKLKEKNSV